MPTATLTSKGQITVPMPVRNLLGLRTGDRVDFVLGPDGRVSLEARRTPFEKLRGILRNPRRKPLGVRAMDSAIRKAVRARWERAAGSAPK
ncbi:MAG: type II toxin-antitoxin system PrlF family antitoxin [Acidobacteria bacterium]|nr:type II toxin-antitoxin system PrlF family antitoxin [Acidobacteriota bacterium]